MPNRHCLPAIVLAFAACLCGAAQSAYIGADEPAPALPQADAFRNLVPDAPTDTAERLPAALSRGSWAQACSLAAKALAGQQPEMDALGVFALCSAVSDQKETVAASLRRLRESEPPPYYYATLTEGVSQLRLGAHERAEAALQQVLRSRPADPLATYFVGELLHARGKDAEAVASFKAVLARWPDYAPAMAAAAQLLAAPRASRAQLKEAIRLSERAAAVEPMNLAYWRQLADLCRRDGQNARAEAITLQWLTPPSVKP